jgi:hypothetical protein
MMQNKEQGIRHELLALIMLNHFIIESDLRQGLDTISQKIMKKLEFQRMDLSG